MRTPRRLTAAAVLLATALGGTFASFTVADAAPDHGQDAVARAADHYGVSEASLRERLREDPRLRVAGAGLYYIDPAPTGTHPPVRLVSQTAPLAETFDLHSKPGSHRTIFLDFDGHTVSDTWWNPPHDALPNGPHPAWDPAADGAAFTSTELAKIQGIFQRVAEDYAPFDVDVTTEDPGEAAIIRSGQADQVYGTRVLITPSTSAHSAVCGGACGGVAFIDVFDRSNIGGLAQPAWVFPHVLGPNHVKYIAEAATHEAGHNLGLDHDSFDGQNNYYDGHGSWGPIMGGAWDRPISQFALNDYPNGNLGGQTQTNPDDIAVVSGNGAPYRADETGASVETAAALPTVPAHIHHRSDVDVFALGTCSGTVSASAEPAPVGPNLDIKLELLNSTSSVLDTDDPPSATVNADVASGLDATVSAASLPTGQYYVRVDGVGRGTATTSYTDYGSVGAYTVQASGCDGAPPPPVIEPPSAPQSLTGSYLGNHEVALTWAAPASNGGAVITGYNVYEDGSLIGTTAATASGVTVNQVPSGVHVYGVAAVNSEGEGAVAEITVDATDQPAQAKPGKPQIGKATPGKRGGKLTAKVRWGPPSTAADPAINGYRVIVYRQKSNGKYVKTSTSPVFGPAARSAKFTTNRRGRYKFAVRARNALGFGALSAKSNAVRPR